LPWNAPEISNPGTTSINLNRGAKFPRSMQKSERA
jgi:hypothetical protein